MNAKAAFALALVVPAFFVTPATAMTGRDAVGACIDRGPSCKYNSHTDGSISIEVTNGGVVTVVSCPSATGDCTVPPQRTIKSGKQLTIEGIIRPASDLRR